MKIGFLVLLSGFFCSVQSLAACSYFLADGGELHLAAGHGKILEIELADRDHSIQVIKEVCDSALQAIKCTSFQLAEDEYIYGEHDGFGVTPTVNLGRDRARLTIGYLDPWIAQFAAENYEDDQNGVYSSVAACEHNRSRIAIEVAERSHEVFLDQEREKARSNRNYPTNFHGLKH
ncbi:MAG: hypothetical protein KGP28_07105 [Bdellovibrionales bacterium]|nr:hypothetical protein [Bdellovibrionales bacterium]